MNALVSVIVLLYVSVLVLIAAIVLSVCGRPRMQLTQPAIPRAIATFHHGERR